MKKIVLMTVFLMAVSSAAAFAADTYEEGPKTLGSTNTSDVQLSKGVEMAYDADTAGLGYVLGAYHTSGTRTFASSSGDAKIFYQDASAATLPTTVPVGTETADFSSWTAL